MVMMQYSSSGSHHSKVLLVSFGWLAGDDDDAGTAQQQAMLDEREKTIVEITRRGQTLKGGKPGSSKQNTAVSLLTRV